MEQDNNIKHERKLKGSAIAYTWYEFKNDWMKEPTVSWI